MLSPGTRMRTVVWALTIAGAVLLSWPAWGLAKEEGNQCAEISAKGINKQMNLHASEILVNCKVLPGGSMRGHSAESLLGPSAFSGSDINVITGAETYPHVTQSESFVWSHGNTIVVTYNDSRGSSEFPVNFSGASVSTNGGESFTRLGTSSPFTGHGANYGDPIVVYNEKLGKWFEGDLVGGCGAQGIGLWTSTNGSEWSVGACANSGTNDDRESLWVDNNPSSPYYGRMYISYNDLATSGALKVTYSDNGTSWSSPVTLFSGFRRNVQLTGSSGSEGVVFLVALDENGGGAGNSGQRNYMYRSTNGGTTWTSATMGSTFTIAGSSGCGGGYFPVIPPIWRQTGYGQPAVGPNGVLHYVYAAHGEGADEADIFYVRSTDNGLTWSTPLRLNTDKSGKAQWMPSLRVTPTGAVEASWYDRRNTTNGENYQRFARVSRDNGATWEADEPLSTEMIPQPTQPDPTVQECYAGDYNYTTANANTAFDTWTDGRVSIEGKPVQKVFFHSISLQAAPLVVTGAATGVGVNKATLNGTVNPNGAETTYQFEYGTTTAYGSKVPAIPKSIGSSSPVEVSEKVEGLQANTTYHFRVVATNAKGTTQGNDQTFTTPSSTPSWVAHSLNFPPGVTQVELLGVGCSSSTTCTTVGGDFNGTWGAHAESGSGAGWAFQTGVTRNPGPKNGTLLGSSCPSTTWCMTVGSYGTSGGVPAMMAQAQNGSTWTLYNLGIPSGASRAELNAVSCTSSSFCMAVGYKMVFGDDKPFAMVFNGSTWVDSNAITATNATLKGVSCPTSTYCVAVGSTGGSALAEVWSGGSWSTTPGVVLPTGGSSYLLRSISCVSSTWCLTVGSYVTSSGNRAIASRWDGSIWHGVANLTWAVGTSPVAYGVSCIWTTQCFAVGTSSGQPFADVYDGVTPWTSMPLGVPPGATGGELRGIICVSSINCEASGWSYFGGTPTGMIETYS